MGDTAPRSLCLGGELLIPLRGAAVLSVHRPWISDKLQSAQTHSISTHFKTGPLTIFAATTATELWRSALHWSATMDQSHPAADTLDIVTPAPGLVSLVLNACFLQARSFAAHGRAPHPSSFLFFPVRYRYRIPLRKYERNT